jgi:hypothetical protein
MNILNFDHTEHENNLDEAFASKDKEVITHLKEHLESSYKSLLFLGKNLNKDNDEDLLNAAIFNIRLLFVYYKREENYERLAELKKLVDVIENSNTSIVDRSVIDSLQVNLN